MNENFEVLNNLLLKLSDIKGNISYVKIRKFPEVVNQINSDPLLSNFNTINQKIWAIRHRSIDFPKCDCGTLLNFDKNNNIFFKFCSRSCPAKVDNFKKKNKETIKSKYGVDNISQLDNIKNKIKENNLIKYGATCVSQVQSIKDKVKQTNLIKYGFEYHQQNREIQEKINNSKRKKFLDIKIPIKFKALKNLYNIIPYEWDDNKYSGVEKRYTFKCMSCNSIFKSTLDDGRLPRCLNCNGLQSGSSMIETKLRNDLFTSLGEVVDFNNREIINPYEIDIVIDNKLGIEVNGAYWHSEDKPSISLLDKSNRSPISLLHFWDFELENKYEICKSIIYSKLNIYENIIYARKCKYEKVKSSQANEFLNNNHLQGASKSSAHYGLYHNDELVFVMSLGKSRFNKNYDYEIHRIASKLNTKIIGGVSKVFKHAIKDLKTTSIITYADKRYSNGNIYKILGFDELPDSAPNYFYCKNGNILSRYQTQKHKLKNILKFFDPELSEYENMILNGYFKVKDCGNKVFRLDKLEKLI